MASTPPESPSNSGKVKEAAVEASFGCILRLKNAVNDEFLQDLLRKVMNTVFFNGEIKFDMIQEGYARFILDQLVALARADAWFLINCCSGTYHFVENCTSNMLEPYLDEIISKLLRCLQKGKQLLKQWALSALAAIAKSSQVKDKPDKERKIALKIFTDVVEEFQEEALKFCESQLLLLFKACNDNEPEFQEVVAHGIGVAAAFGGSIFKPLVGEAVSALNANISDPMAMHRDYIMAHDTAVTALGKICLFHEDRINAKVPAEFSMLNFARNANSMIGYYLLVFSTWLSHLPIKNNLLEVKIAHDLLCSIVEISKDELLRRDFIHLPRIIAAFAENHYHQKVLPALTKAMDDCSDSKIQVQAAMATYHFVENCTSNMLEPYLDEIISKLLKCLQDRFLEYYRTVMPYLKFVMTKAQGESYGLLLSATISCMTAIWIGKDKFSDDTQQVVQVLASTPISNLDIHDPMRIQG
ncbi:hypothetical protein DKX38_011501 [Salix brachista]|uniref:Uncharacterized protein n=1 Tax=Salix brachista TaxID=2182728 RepID=A0A5N5LYV0_9ROSI|nr:hypothetical protein DKX38_011501 [Salix brachista]